MKIEFIFNWFKKRLPSCAPIKMPTEEEIKAKIRKYYRAKAPYVITASEMSGQELYFIKDVISIINEILSQLSTEQKKKIDEQKILDTLRYVGRYLRRALTELETTLEFNVRKRLHHRTEETLSWVESALEEFNSLLLHK